MDASTIRFLKLYRDQAPTTGFLSRFFRKTFHRSEKVAMDIQRDDDDVAIAVHTVKSGGRANEATQYTNKEFTPTVFKEEFNLSAYDLLKRSAGRTNFEEPNFVADAQQEVMDGMARVQRKVSRAIELMSSQMFQGGIVTNIDSDGNTVYTIDFKMKTTHKITVGTTWAADGTTGDPLADLASAARVIRRDGKRDPTAIVCGETALTRLFKNADVRERFDNRSMIVGELNPGMKDSGATRQGRINVGNYWLDVWSYDGQYKHPQTGNYTMYIPDDNLIMLTEGARYDLTWGDIPRLVDPDPRLAGFLPGRVSDPVSGMDLIVNGWVSKDGTHLTVQVGCRPLTIPTAIDTYAFIDVTA